MNRIVSVLLIVLISLPCYAQDKSTETADVRAIELDGKPFVAFDELSAQSLLQMRLDYPKLELALVKSTELIKIKDQELGAMTKALDNANAQALEYREQAVDWQKKVEAQDAWYLSGYFWFCVGVVVGGGAAIGIFYAAK